MFFAEPPASDSERRQSISGFPSTCDPVQVKVRRMTGHKASSSSSDKIEQYLTRGLAKLLFMRGFTGRTGDQRETCNWSWLQTIWTLTRIELFDVPWPSRQTQPLSQMWAWFLEGTRVLVNMSHDMSVGSSLLCGCNKSITCRVQYPCWYRAMLCLVDWGTLAHFKCEIRNRKSCVARFQATMLWATYAECRRDALPNAWSGSIEWNMGGLGFLTKCEAPTSMHFILWDRTWTQYDLAAGSAQHRVGRLAG